MSWCILSVDPGVVNCGIALVDSEGQTKTWLYQMSPRMKKLEYHALLKELSNLAHFIVGKIPLGWPPNDVFVIVEKNSKYPFSEFAPVLCAYISERTLFSFRQFDRVSPLAVMSVMRSLGLPPHSSRSQKKRWTRDYVERKCKKEEELSFDECDALFNAWFFARKKGLMKLLPLA